MRATGRWRRSTSRPCRRRAGPRRRSRRRWTTGTRRPPMPQSPGWPAPPEPTRFTRLFFRYGCRDFRSIGHKAIYVANSLRTLQCIGWQHAEPVLRSLAYALLESQRRRQSRRARLRGRPVVAAQPGPRGEDQGRLDRGQPDRGGRGRPARHAPPGLRRRGVRPGGRALEPRGRAAVDLGRPVRRRGRAAACASRASSRCTR